MTLTQELIDGWNKGVRPFRAALHPMLTGSSIFAASCLLAVLLDLAEWPAVAVAIIAIGCLAGSIFMIYAWIVMFRAAGFIKRGHL
jgi:hypothetical protein